MNDVTTLVWIDAREAIIVRSAGEPPERVESDVPPRHRTAGHVRHDPGIRHGGGMRQDAGEPHRLEHLDRFVAEIAERLPPASDVLILGPGTVRERLERRVRALDSRLKRSREIRCEASRRLTDPQLVARLRSAAGQAPYRRTVGAYRWTEPLLRPASGPIVPRRVAAKRRRDRRPDS